jgi:hypothetical protein
VNATLEYRLTPNEAVCFIRRDLENLFKRVDELGDQHELVSKRLGEMSFDDNSKYMIVSDMMGKAGLSLFQLWFRIERLAASIESMIELYSETKRYEIVEEIIDSCEQLSCTTNDLCS